MSAHDFYLRVAKNRKRTSQQGQKVNKLNRKSETIPVTTHLLSEN